MEELEFERKKLKETEEKLEEIEKGEEKVLATLPKKYGNNPVLLANLMSITSVKINNIAKMKDKPYFARIDFKENGKDKKDKLYIGKIGVSDLDGNTVITDWRAPISTLYYDSNLGDVEYIAPQGNVKGNLSLKRQIIINNRELESIFDVDSVSDDELLRPYLGASADNRLKNIVATIQNEQNDIIRRNINEDIVVQGVAGSGKTTVALHRIAYLMYNNADKYKAGQFMVIGPNKFFLNYISNVLPDLDASNACQYTFEELALDYIKEKIVFEDSTKKLSDIISKNQKYEYIKYKTSIKYKNALEKFMKDIESSLFKDEGLVVNSVNVLSKKDIMNVYNSINGTSINQRATMTAKVIANRIKNDEDIYDYIKKEMDKIIANEQKEEIRKKLAKQKLDMLKSLSTKGFEEQLKKYMNITSFKVTKLYEEFINNLDNYVSNDELKENTLKCFKNKTFENEDLPALMYIKYILYGSEEFSKIKCVVVDESQDFGEFYFYMLRQILPNAKFSIFGDMAQGIYDYRGIDSWDYLVKELLPDASLLNLKKSYRTSIEIMNEANKISKFIGLGEAKPVIRSSGPIIKSKVAKDKQNEHIVNRVKYYLEQGYKSIAIVYKNNDEMLKINQKLKDNNIESEIIYKDQENYNGGVCILTSYLSKGLEFDVVIVVDVEEDKYSTENKLDMKLLYVAMTRALHQLELVYNDKIIDILI